MKTNYKNIFINVKKNKIFKAFIIITLILLPVFIELLLFNNRFSMHRFILELAFSFYMFSHLLFPLQKMYEFIYKYRYMLGILLFLFLVLFQFNGSSVSFYNELIEPNYPVENGNVLFGKQREVRSDEWAGTTPSFLSQLTEKNNLSPVNKTMMGGINKNISLFPGMPNNGYAALLSPKKLGFLFLPPGNAYSWYWYIEYFLTFFATFEFMMILTKKNRFWAFLSAIIVTFSSAIQWWDFTNIIYQGMIATVCFYYLLKSKKYWKKFLYSFVIGYMGSLYILTLYPAFAVPFAYFFLGILIWILLIEENKSKWKELFLVCGISIVVMGVLLIPIFYESIDVYNLMTNTVYPGSRFSVGGEGWQQLFDYVVDLISPFTNISNPSEASTFFSFYPIPLILGCIVLYKNKKNIKKDLLVPILMIVLILLSIWDYIPLPNIVAKISLLYMSMVGRSNIAVNFVGLILLLVILSNYSNKLKINWKDLLLLIISFIFSIFAFIIENQLYNFFSIKRFIFIVIIIGTLTYMLLSLKFNKFFGLVMMIIVFITGIFVHPLNITLNTIYEKPIAKEIQTISKNDVDAIWASISSPIYLPNYALANGATIINSINYYPNYRIIDKLDSDHEFVNIWNRYAHVEINLKNEKTSFSLTQNDLYKIDLYIDDLCKLNIKYLLSIDSTLEKNSSKKTVISKLYDKDNIFIYKTNCE